MSSTNMAMKSNNDAVAELLSLPVDFVMDPLLTVTPSSPVSLPSSPGKRQASISSTSASESERTSASPEPVVPLKKSRLSLDDKDQKTKERILRNRAAAQESRDKKRRYVSDLEASNKKLTEENERANKKMKTLEHQNLTLSTQLDALARQLANLQAQIKFSAVAPILFNDFCDSARIVKKESITFNHTSPNNDNIKKQSASEVVNQDQNTTTSRTTELTPNNSCPTLSPCFSSDDESVHSPNTIVNQDFQLDDLFDWEGQQDLARF